MSIIKPKGLVLFPVMPSWTGNGLAQRCAVFLSALERVSQVDVIVLPIFGEPGQRLASDDWQKTTRFFSLPHQKIINSHFALISRIEDPQLRLTAFRQFNAPSLTVPLTAPLLAECLEITGDSSYRFLHTSRAYCAGFALQLARRLTANSDRPVITTLDVDEDDASVYEAMSLEAVRSGRKYNAGWHAQEAAAHRSLALEHLKKFDCLFVSSGPERRQLTQHYALNAQVLNNSVVMQMPFSSTQEENSILFVGAMDYLPNRQGMNWFISKVWTPYFKSRNLKLNIVGGGASERLKRQSLQSGVNVVGWASDLAYYYQKAMLVVAPIQIGGGTRIKLLEAASYNVPIVSTSVGAEGLGFLPDQHMWQADSAMQFRNAIIDAVGSPTKRARLTTNARRLVSQHNDRRHVIAKLAKIFTEFLK